DGRPALRRGQEESAGQNGIRWPQDRRRGGCQAQAEPDKAGEVVRDTCRQDRADGSQVQSGGLSSSGKIHFVLSGAIFAAASPALEARGGTRAYSNEFREDILGSPKISAFYYPC